MPNAVKEPAGRDAAAEIAGGACNEEEAQGVDLGVERELARAVGEAAGAFMRQVAAALEAPSAHALPWRDAAGAARR